MNIERHNTKMFNVLSIVLLAAILLTIVVGIIIQRQGLSSMFGEKGVRRGQNFMRPQLTQTSPTGKLVVTTGILLLTIGFVMIVVILLVRRNWLHHNPS
jgi:hypothetical protein